MILSDPQKAALQESTRRAAAVFVEDMAHVRQLLGNHNLTPSVLRGLTPIIRRILIEGDLAAIAPSRIGRFRLQAPDYRPFYRANESQPFEYMASDGGRIFVARRNPVFLAIRPPPAEIGYDPNQTVLLTIDDFNRQRVLCLEGDWVSRKDVIKYLANVTGGVHSRAEASREEKMLLRLSALVKQRQTGTGGIRTDLRSNREIFNDGRFVYEPTTLDPVLVAFGTTILFLAKSDDIKRLEAAIYQELGATPLMAQ